MGGPHVPSHGTEAEARELLLARGWPPRRFFLFFHIFLLFFFIQNKVAHISYVFVLYISKMLCTVFFFAQVTLSSWYLFLQ